MFEIFVGEFVRDNPGNGVHGTFNFQFIRERDNIKSFGEDRRFAGFHKKCLGARETGNGRGVRLDENDGEGAAGQTCCHLFGKIVKDAFNRGAGFFLAHDIAADKFFHVLP